MLLTCREAMAGCCGGRALLTVLTALTQAGLAEAGYPGQPVKIIVPYPAGEGGAGWLYAVDGDFDYARDHRQAFRR
jgi:hypothetical protein